MSILNKNALSKAAVAASMALTILGTSVVTADAGKRERRIGLGIVGGLVAGALINEGYRNQRRSHRRHYARDCWWEKRRRWSNYHDRYVVRRIKVCD